MQEAFRADRCSAARIGVTSEREASAGGAQGTPQAPWEAASHCFPPSGHSSSELWSPG